MAAYKRVFLSFPMRGYTGNEIIEMKKEMIPCLKQSEIPIDNYIEQPSWCKERLWCLGEAIKKLGECDAAIFHYKWKEARGCIVERTVAEQYGIEIIDMEVPHDDTK